MSAGVDRTGRAGHPRRVIGLIAAREITTRLRSRAYLLVTILLAVLMVAGVLVTSLLQGHSAPTRVAVLQGEQATVGAAVMAGAAGRVDVVRVADDAAGTRAVRDGRADVFVTTAGASKSTAASASAGSSDLRAVVREDVGADTATRLAAAARSLALADQISALAGDPATVAQAVAHARVVTRSLNPQPAPDGTRLLLGFVTAVLIFIALQTAGQSVAMGVVEEKSSRVVEILLATVKPWQLMAGKIIGLGLLGILQVLVIALPGLGAALATHSLDLSGVTATSMIIWLVVWFALGYSAFAVVFAALGALVSRTEEIGGATAPVLMVVIAGYVTAVSVLPGDPHNHVVAIMSLLPPFAPTLMPVRLAIGGVPVWQTVLSLALLTATIPVLVVVAARIYRNAVVRSGARVTLRDALRG